MKKLERDVKLNQKKKKKKKKGISYNKRPFHRFLFKEANLLECMLYISVPSQVISGSLIVTPVETSSFDITWTPGNGGYTGFHITPTCRDAYGDVLQNVSAVDTTTNHSTVTRLSPGSQCDYNIVTLAGNQTASIYFNNTRRTFETGKKLIHSVVSL